MARKNRGSEGYRDGAQGSRESGSVPPADAAGFALTRHY
jgi:hypothetical protein